MRAEMGKFSFGKWKNKITYIEEMDEEILKRWVEYVCNENEKGKIPLIIVGAGASANEVKIALGENAQGRMEFAWSEKGLPCLQEMMQKLKEMTLREKGTSNDNEMHDLLVQFEIMTDDMQNVSREWLGQIFTIFEKSHNNKIKKIWKNFCDWFFFSCIEYEENNQIKYFGALNTKTSKAAEEVAKLYDSVDAICLSANFDNYINYALTETEGNQKGVSIFEKGLAERYLKRNRRGTDKFENKPCNRCVLHANGDVFWLYCSGEKGEGYCPDTNVKKPAFDNRKITCAEDLYCDFCNSPLVTTMTMPGTYEKDYNTRTIIETIWKYLSTKISSIITVGLSCNWDDIILKFILQLMKEIEIPLLDINNFSDKAKNGKSQLAELVVKQSYLEACSIHTNAAEGVEYINNLIDEYKKANSKIQTEVELGYKKKLQKILSRQPYIKRLSNVSQLGLKSYWLETYEKNERWSHSVEVAEIATEMYEKLSENSCKIMTPHERIMIYASGLLHDCGHLPFSHLLEDVFEELSWCMQGETTTFKHSHYTKWVINQLYNDSSGELKNFLGKYGVDTEEIVNLIEGRYGLAYIDTLLNSSLDADKVAYVFTDAEKSNKNLALKKEDFLNKFLEHAYITQEGMVAFDGESAWYAMRLLDERQRMYDELYYDTRIRCLEAMAKYIITTYFVQKYNDKEMLYHYDETDKREKFEDLGNQHILDAIDDLYKMLGQSYQTTDLSLSVGDKMKSSIEYCMQLILLAKRGFPANLPDEINILLKMCEQLIGRKVDFPLGKEDHLTYISYRDVQLDKLVEKLSYEELILVRKKIILNYPGTILIDIYKTTKYFSPSSLRASHLRPDGTECEQATILVPRAPKEEWRNQESKAEITLAEYADCNGIDVERKVVFHVFRIGKDKASCEHAINMLKKEMKHMRR